VIVLDTHVLVWWVNDDADLSPAAKAAIQAELDDEDGLILISSITAWEIALLVQKGRLALSTQIDDWLATVSDIEGVRFVPVDNDIAVQSTQLPGDFHPDPADRMIVALARHVSAPLVTAETRIRSYPHVKSLW
jgi:PIN domain nuclease of toxin-antitoxin system